MAGRTTATHQNILLKGSNMLRSDFTLRGVIPPIITPLTADGQVDVTSLRRLVDFQIDAGVDALFVLGTGGEGPYLTAPSRDATLAAVVQQTAGRVPVLAGISDVGTARSLENLVAAEHAGADGVVATPPFYGDAGQAEIIEHFRRLAAATDLPLIGYDIPSKVHVKIDPETTSLLAHEGVLSAIKDSSGDEDGFRTVIELTADLPTFACITGSDLTADAALLMGGDGMIVGLGNVDPHGFVRLYRACANEDWRKAREEQTRLRALRRMTQVAAGRVGPFSATIAAFKSALVTRNVIANDLLQPPLLPLTDDERKSIAGLLAAAGLESAFDTIPTASSAALN
jgi:4-hydroxy-tetrahydrodipicolinate synthase